MKEVMARNKILMSQIREIYPSNLRQDIDPSNPERPVITLPVVVHIIELEPGRISDSVILQRLENTNKIFAGTYRNDTTGKAANTRIELCMVSKDPEGNPTTGIIRYDGSKIPGYDSDEAYTSTTDRLVKQYAPSWNTCVNIYLVRTMGSGRNGEAVVGNGRIITVRAGTNEVVWAHEAGHAFGLLHTFTGWCDETDCNTGGDHVCDTPPTYAYKSGNRYCVPESPCGVKAQPGNIMDYHDCAWFFTRGQADRMFAFINPIVNSLSSTQNLIATGCGSSTPPLINQLIMENRICGSDSVTVSIDKFNSGFFVNSIAWEVSDGSIISMNDPYNLKNKIHYNSGENTDITIYAENEWGKLAQTFKGPQVIFPEPILNFIDTTLAESSDIILREENTHFKTAWYKDSLQQILLSEEKELKILNIKKDTSFYVQNTDTTIARTLVTTDPANTYTGMRFPIDSIGVVFEVLKPVTLQSVDVRFETGDIALKITDSLNEVAGVFDGKMPDVYTTGTVVINKKLQPGRYKLTKAVNSGLNYHNRIGLLYSTEYPFILNDYFIIESGINFDPTALAFFNWKISSEDFNCTGDLQKINIKVNVVSGLETEKQTRDLLYPNPVSAGSVNFGRIVNKYALLDARGTVIEEGEDSDSMKVGNLPAGIYFLNLDNNMNKIFIQ
jgi:hypothetical protein